MKNKNLSYSFFRRLVFYLFVFSLPFQTSKFFFVKPSFILGVKKDLLAPALYFKYIIGGVFVFLSFKFIAKKLKANLKLVLISLTFFLINLIISLNKPITAYKIFQIILFVFVVLGWFKVKEEIRPKHILWAILGSSMLEFFLAIYQFLNGISLQGAAYFLGERLLSINSPNVAKTVFFNKYFLRPYGTFSHPNSLAGFYLLLYFSVLTSKAFKKAGNLVKGIVLFISSVLVFLSFSKMAIATYFVLNFLYIVKSKDCGLCKLARSFSIGIVSLVFLNASFRKESLYERVVYIIQAKNIFFSYPLFGVGLGAYLNALAKKYAMLEVFKIQPVHNVLLLLLCETGVLGAGLLTSLLVLKRKKAKQFFKRRWLQILAVLITSFFDHYWWTLPQNLFGLVFIFF